MKISAIVFRISFVCLFLLVNGCGNKSEKEIIEINGKKIEVEKGFAEVGDGARLYYERAGQGTPVILIHAYSMDHRMWDPQFAELARHYDVVRYDLRGFGRSDIPPDKNVFIQANDLKDLMDYLGIQKAHLAGLSLGAFVCVDAMILYPEQVISITVSSGGVRDTIVPDDATEEEIAKARARTRTEERELIKSVKKEGLMSYKKRWLEKMIEDCGPYGEDIRGDLWEMIKDWSAWQVLNVEPRWELDPPVAVQIKNKKPQTPVLVLIGKDDTEGSHNSSEYLERITPNSCKHYFEDAGHFANMERPKEYTKVLLNFFRSVERNKD